MMPVEMNLSTLFLRRVPVAFALCAGFFLIPAGRAQPEPQIVDNRFLFIFDTSAEMKKRLPAVQAEVNGLMSASMGGQLRTGDSLGVWTFDQDLRTGQFPLQHWRPEDAMTIASSINKFVGKQHYANGTRFNVLQPQLNQVIQNSGRLTVLIFCDGEDEINWTPYDDGINRVFQQRLAEQKRTRQPFVLVLRTQLGQYAGCTMNFPPGMVSVPEFPPPPAPVSPPPLAPPPAPVIKPPIGPPLIIIGTKVETNWPPAPAPAPPLPTNPSPVTPANVVPATPTNPVTPPPTIVVPTTPTNPVAPPLPTNPVPAVQTNAAPASSANSFAPTNFVAPKNLIAPPPPTNPAPAIQTNAAPAPPADLFAPTNSAPVTPTNLVSTPPSNPMTFTNPVAPSSKDSGPDHKGALVIGVALLIAAGALAALAIFRSRRTDRGSLITRSMRKD
jgi:hypothetical protein